MAEKKLEIPLAEEDVRDLKLGDIVYLSGTFYTARDEAHMHALELLEKGEKLPVELKDGVIFHCGPILQKEGKGGKGEQEWRLVAAGPTTSTRMNSIEPQFIEKTGIRGIIGKGGMSAPTVEAMKKFGCVYFAITGGAAVIAAKGVKRVPGVHWFELGMPEALWILEGDNFGPLMVSIDAHGNSLFANIEKEVQKNVPEIRKRLGLKV